MFHSVVAELQASAPGSRSGIAAEALSGYQGQFLQKENSATVWQTYGRKLCNCARFHPEKHSFPRLLSPHPLSPLLSPGPSLVAISARTLALLFPQSISHSLTTLNAPNTSLTPWKAKAMGDEVEQPQLSSTGWLFCAPGSELWIQSEADSVGEGASWCLVVTA